MTLDRIHKFYENTYFCQVSKWGNTLTKEEAKSLGIPLDEESEAPKAPIRRTRKNSKATTTNKEGIE